MSTDFYFQQLRQAFPALAHLPRDRVFGLLVLCSGLVASLFISLATPVSTVQTISFFLLVTAFMVFLAGLDIVND